MTSISMEEEYVLSRTFLSDGEPVRSLCHVLDDPQQQASASTSAAAASSSPNEANEDDSLKGMSLLTGSQGAMITRFAMLLSSNNAMSTHPGNHSHHVTALLSIPNSVPELQGGYVSGCKDNTIRIFNSANTLVRSLVGHTNAVTSLSWVTLTSSSSGSAVVLLASGSWDGTARLWDVNTGQCVATLPGHENTVCVQGLPPPSSGEGKQSSSRRGCLATGSAGVAQGNNIVDHKIRLWDLDMVMGSGMVEAKLRTTVADHGGPVRGLCLDPETQFLASCSNDGTIKIRDSSTAECLITLTHPGDSTPLVLDVTAIGHGRYVSVTEDGTAVVWNADDAQGQKPQVVLHPNCVWCVIPLPNGDFVTGCQDGMTRVFTSNPTRMATQTEIEAFQHAVTEAVQKKSSGGGGPSQEEIAKLPKWEMPHPAGKSEGQVQVFSKDGTKAIAAQWSAASATWIEVGEVTGRNENAGTIDGVSYDHVFPIEIDVRGGGVRTLRIGYNNGDNPFNTAQAFIDEHELDQNYLAQIADYIRQRAGQSAPTIGMGDASAASSSSGSSGWPAAASSSGSSPATAPSTAAPTYDHLPMKSYMTFETGTEKKAMDKITSKIREFSSSLSKDVQLSASDEAALDSLASTLAATSRYHATKVSEGELGLIRKLMSTWPHDRVFPCIDLARLVVLHPDASSSKRASFWSDVIRMILEKCEAVHEDKPEGISAVAVPMLSLRLCANACKGIGSADAIAGRMKSALDCAQLFALSDNKNVRLSVATLALNASSSMMRSPGKHNSSPEQLLSLLQVIIGSGSYESEATTRSLVALGTTVLIGEDVNALAVSIGFPSMLQNVGNHGPKAAAVKEEIRSILGG